MANKYPELEKLIACKPQHDAIRNFLTYLQDEGCTIQDDVGMELYMQGSEIDALVYEFLDIDCDKVENERQSMIMIAYLQANAQN